MLMTEPSKERSMYRLTDDERTRREALYLRLRDEVWRYTASMLEEVLNEAREEYAGLELQWRHDHSDPRLEERREVETAIKLWSERLRSELEMASSDGSLEDLLLSANGDAAPRSLRVAANGLALLLAEREILKG